MTASYSSCGTAFEASSLAVDPIDAASLVLALTWLRNEVTRISIAGLLQASKDFIRSCLADVLASNRCAGCGQQGLHIGDFADLRLEFRLNALPASSAAVLLPLKVVSRAGRIVGAASAVFSLNLGHKVLFGASDKPECVERIGDRIGKAALHLTLVHADQLFPRLVQRPRRGKRDLLLSQDRQLRVCLGAIGLEREIDGHCPLRWKSSPYPL